MKPGRLNEITTVLFASSALINGGLAVERNNEAVRADAQTVVYVQQGDYAQALQFEAQADNERTGRNISGGLTILNLGLTGLYASLAVAKRREREDKI